MKNVLIGGLVFAVVMSMSIAFILPRGPIYTAVGIALAFVAMRLTWGVRQDRLPTLQVVSKTAVLGALLFAMIYGIQRVTGPFFFVS